MIGRKLIPVSQGGRDPSSISDSALLKVHTTFSITQCCGPARPDSPSFVHFKGLYSRLWPWKVKQLKTSIECTVKQNPENTLGTSVGTLSDTLPWAPARVSWKLTVKNDWRLKDSHTKGWGPFCSVWHGVLSRWTPLHLHSVVTCFFVFLFFLKGEDSCQGLVPWPHSPLAGSNTHLWHFKMELATAWH